MVSSITSLFDYNSLYLLAVYPWDACQERKNMGSSKYGEEIWCFLFPEEKPFRILLFSGLIADFTAG